MIASPPTRKIRTAITLEGASDSESGVLFLSVAMILCEHQLSPDSLVWSAFPEKNEVRVWVVLEGTAGTLRAVVQQCRDLPGVTFVSELPPENRVLERIRDLESRSPFGAGDQTRVGCEAAQPPPEFTD